MENNKKRKISVIIVSIALVLLLGISFTYAYFSSKKTTDNHSIQAGTLLISFEDENLNVLNLSDISPIYDSEIKSSASKINFTVNNEGTTASYIDISLTDIVMSDELSNLEFKWALYSGNTEINNGNFRNVVDNKQLLMNNLELAKNGSNDYTLYIWISESDLDQTDLMEKSFSAKVKVKANQEKGAELLSTVVKNANKNEDGTFNTTTNFNKIAVSQTYYDVMPLMGGDQSVAVLENGLYQGIDDDGETYYFRGNVENNYVRIDGLKWKDTSLKYAVHTNNWDLSFTYNTLEEAQAFCSSEIASGVTVYAYLGYDDAQKCIDNNITQIGRQAGEDMLFRITRINGDGTIRIMADSAVGESKFNESYNSEEYVGYTYKTRTGYKIGNPSEEEFTKSVNASTAYYYSDEVTIDGVNGGYTLINPVAYTGEQCNNDKSLCENKYTQFSTNKSKNNSLYKVTTVESSTNMKYVAYQYKGEAVFDESTNNDSTIKKYIEDWYKANLTVEGGADKEYSNVLASTRFCNDTTSTINEYGYLYYSPYNRININNEHTPQPTFICPNTDKTYGGEYDLKVGLISADEVSFAGGLHGNANLNYFMNRGTWYWAGSPYRFTGNSADEFFVRDNGDFNNSIVDYPGSVVPVSNLKSDILYSSGTGTRTDPYVISVN